MEGRILRVADLAREAGCTERTIYKHLRKAEESGDIAPGHVERRGQNGTWLDAVAQEAVKARLLQPLPVAIVDSSLGAEVERLNAKIIELQERVISLQQQDAEHRELLGKAEGQRLLLEATEARLQASEGQRQAAEQQATQATAEATAAAEQIADLQQQLQMERERRLTFGEWWSRWKRK